PELSLAFLTLYAELQQQLESVTERPGSVFEQTIRNTLYLKAQVEAGGRRTSIHLGRADDPAVRARADGIVAEMQRAKARRQIVRTLRGAGFGQPSPPIADVCEAVAAAGLFRRGAILIGTGAYQCFPALVGRTLPGAAMMTQDADIATATLALAAEPGDLPGDTETGGNDDAEQPKRSLLDILKQADPTFEGVPSLDKKAFPSRFKARSGFLFELLS
ncbi:GSU2403 family nucleotidyltransferase fold protein, partial [Nostoc sp. NIES-2111]